MADWADPLSGFGYGHGCSACAVVWYFQLGGDRVLGKYFKLITESLTLFYVRDSHLEEFKK